MIRTINGTLTHVEKGKVIIETAGIGYLLSIPTRYQPKLGESVKYFTYQHVREDILALYGFQDFKELYLFEQLLTVQSIGPKSALAIIAAYDYQAIIEAIGNGNVAFFQSVSGVGKKSAIKIIVELKSKIIGKDDLTIPNQNDELLRALRSLGFEPQDIQDTLSILPPNLAKLEDQVTWVLREMGK